MAACSGKKSVESHSELTFDTFAVFDAYNVFLLRHKHKSCMSIHYSTLEEAVWLRGSTLEELWLCVSSMRSIRGQGKATHQWVVLFDGGWLDHAWLLCCEGLLFRLFAYRVPSQGSSQGPSIKGEIVRKWFDWKEKHIHTITASDQAMQEYRWT